ncbi:hypothetical protein [Nonomuraea sp. NPDC005692]|uniref:hypothetical protein n=1 Tax=Nonomuraea sp. NPDC005692 TaxID=3157168 RepID=UPI0033CA9DFB
MKIWILGEELAPVEISDEYAAQRFVAWMFGAGRAELEHTLKTFAHTPWKRGGLGATTVDGPADLEALARVVQTRWNPLTVPEQRRAQ